VAFGWAMGIVFGAYTSAGVSGGHMNPAVTIALAAHKQFPWRRVPLYTAAQVFGAFMASALVYGDYIDALDNFDGGVRQITGPNGTAGIWATYPAPWLTVGNGFFDQMVGTGFLLAGIFALNDESNSAPSSALRPILAGMLVFAIGTSFGLNDGYAINPARDFGPRIFTAMTHGSGVFSEFQDWWWVPLIAPVIGAIIGSSFYVFLVKFHHPISLKINLRLHK
jgi:MIP family channel proteins